MLRTYQEREVIIRIRAHIDKERDTSESPSADILEAEGLPDESAPSDFDHVQLSGHSYRMATITFADQQQLQDPGARLFERELRTFLYQELDDPNLGTQFHFRERNLPRVDDTMVCIKS